MAVSSALLMSAHSCPLGVSHSKTPQVCLHLFLGRGDWPSASTHWTEIFSDCTRSSSPFLSCIQREADTIVCFVCPSPSHPPFLDSAISDTFSMLSCIVPVQFCISHPERRESLTVLLASVHLRLEVVGLLASDTQWASCCGTQLILFCGSAVQWEWVLSSLYSPFGLSNRWPSLQFLRGDHAALGAQLLCQQSLLRYHVNVMCNCVRFLESRGDVPSQVRHYASRCALCVLHHAQHQFIETEMRLPTIESLHATKCPKKRKLCSRSVATWIGDIMLFLSSTLAIPKNVFMIQTRLILWVQFGRFSWRVGFKMSSSFADSITWLLVAHAPMLASLNWLPSKRLMVPSSLWIGCFFCPGTSQHRANFPHKYTSCGHDRRLRPLPMLCRQRSACQRSNTTPTSAYSKMRNYRNFDLCATHRRWSTPFNLQVPPKENHAGCTFVYSHMSCLVRMITVHCITTGTSTILQSMKCRVALVRHGPVQMHFVLSVHIQQTRVHVIRPRDTTKKNHVLRSPSLIDCQLVLAVIV